MAGIPRHNVGRPPNTAPKLAFEVRRYMTLVQVLAMDKRDGLKLTDLQALAQKWGVNPYGEYSELLQRMAQHVVEYHREK